MGEAMSLRDGALQQLCYNPELNHLLGGHGPQLDALLDWLVANADRIAEATSHLPDKKHQLNDAPAIRRMVAVLRGDDGSVGGAL